MVNLEEIQKKLLENEELLNVSSLEEFIAKLKEAGIELTEQDINELCGLIEKAELSDEDLENASGGMASRYDIMLLRKAKGLILSKTSNGIDKASILKKAIR